MSAERITGESHQQAVVDPTTVAGAVETDDPTNSEDTVVNDPGEGEMDETTRQRCAFCTGDFAESEELYAAGVPTDTGFD